MTRPLRLEFPGAIWHVTARGNRKEDIFLSDEDRRRFLRHLAATVEMYRWRIHAWVLMTNHYHLVFETPEPNLGRGMHRLNGAYSQSFNKVQNRVGHVFQGRYKAILVERESHLLELTRYVVLNPVRAGIVARPDGYVWSSYPETAGHRPAADWLETGWTLGHFDREPGLAQQRYEKFVSEARGCDYRPWDELAGQIYLGGRAFQRQIAGELAARELQLDIPAAQQALPERPGLHEVLTAVATAFETEPAILRSRTRGPGRKAFALLARRLCAAPSQRVAQELGVRHWSASHLASAGERLEARDPVFQAGIERARRLLVGI